MNEKGTKEKLLVIIGPTAVGKSKVAIFLAQKLGSLPAARLPARQGKAGEIISADSMQVYRGMDIGTAKPSPEDRTKVKHHLIDIVDPSYDFSVGQYQSLARKKISDVTKRSIVPILVGGSGLYIKAVIDKLDFPKGTIGSSKRIKLEGVIQAGGKKALYDKLRELDPKACSKIHPNNTRRVIRALEVIAETGELFSKCQEKWRQRKSIYDVRMIGLNMPRALLYAKINRRVDEMMENGLVEELESLSKEGFGRAITSKQALGYKELLDYLEGKVSREEAAGKIKIRTRQLAKRQLTWFKADPRVSWIDTRGKSASEVASQIVDSLEQSRFLPRLPTLAC